MAGLNNKDGPLIQASEASRQNSHFPSEGNAVLTESLSH